jgi:hypothetical protein
LLEQDPGASCFAALALAPGYLISRLRRCTRLPSALTGLDFGCTSNLNPRFETLQFRKINKKARYFLL